MVALDGSKGAVGPMLGFEAPRPAAPRSAIRRSDTPVPDPQPLNVLTSALEPAEVRGDPDVAVTDVAYASSACVRGTLFFCVPGAAADGHDFAADAVARGAVVLMVERWLDAPGGPGSVATTTQVRVDSVRGAMGPAAAAFFGHPGDALATVGVTGTNGKTTTTFLLESVFAAAGLRPGLIGTTGIHIGGGPLPSAHTTPEAPDLHRLLRAMADDGVRALAMEVSSHGLDQDRVGGLVFDVAAFTNLTQDHLDYHGTLEEYFAAKRRLFTPDHAASGVVNVGDPYGRRLADDAAIEVTTFSADGSTPADLMAGDLRSDANGVSCTVDGVALRSRLRGGYNIENIVAAFACARAIGIEDAAIVEGIERLPGVPGRMEPVEAGQPFPVVVDYAHTPDGVENVLRGARAFTRGRLIAVLGCGGDRDRAKRPLMGRAATSNADLTILTSDNPRSEDPMAIIAEIEPGARAGGGAYRVEVDRRAAIRAAVDEAGQEDVVVIAGKGHETGQEFADRTIEFDDRVVAAEELQARGGEAG